MRLPSGIWALAIVHRVVVTNECLVRKGAAMAKGSKPQQARLSDAPLKSEAGSASIKEPRAVKPMANTRPASGASVSIISRAASKRWAALRRLADR
jgi:hypothetical protein